MTLVTAEKLKVPEPALPFLAGGGEMGARIRAFDWAASSLGPAEAWPQSLKTSVRIMLTSRQPIWIGWGPDLLFLYNDAYKAIIGGKHPHSLGRPARVVWSEIWNDIAPMLSQAMTGDEGTYFESHLLIMERNGYPEETYYTFSYSPIPDDDGNVGGIICANTDDTQRVISERQLALLRDLSAGTADVRASDDACRRSALALATDPQDIVFAMIYLGAGGETNLDLKGICGIEPGHPAAPDFLVNGDSAWPTPGAMREADQVVELAAHFDAAFPAGPWAKAPVRAVALTLPATGEFGCQGVLIVGLNPFRLFDDKYRSFLRLVAGQITAAIANAEAYQNERRKAEALAEIDRAKTAFFSNISHEFRTPLTLMLGPLEDKLAKSADRPSEDTEWVRIVHRNGLRLLRLVNTLLDFSRLEAGRAQAVFRPVDLAAVTAELASNFRAATDKAGLTLVVDCPPLAEPVFVDWESWEKIVLNLLSNAFKFTLEGQIAVSLRQVDRTVELAVRDSGIGIPQAEIPRLFERFHRVANAGGRSHEGSGIGLSLVQELTRLHGGTVRVESSEKGSCFYVSIPLGAAHLPPQLFRNAAHSPPRPLRAEAFLEEALRWLPAASADEIGLDAELTRPDATDDRPRVVLADDNADMRDYVRRLLDDRYAVDVVADGEEALASIKAKRPDLVLTDVMMPRLDGLGLLRVIRSDPDLRDLPVILLSARAGGDAEVQGRTAGADDYLTKPFSARELVARIGAALELARVRRQAAEAIRESEARLRALVNATSQATYRMSPDWTEVRELDGRDMLGEAQAPETPRWLNGDIHPDDYTSVWNDIREAIRTKSVFDREYRVRNPDGGWSWTHSRAVPLLDANGETYEWFGAAADVTARRAAQEELSALNADLERRVTLAAAQLVQLQKMESIGQLTGGIAHDFNNLLMAILTSLGIAKGRLKGDDPRQSMLIENALQAAQRGAALTQRMLAFARKQELKPEPVSVPELVLGMADLLGSSIGPQIRIETRHAFGTSRAMVDANQMEMAILNLAVNARDAMPEGGLLTISSDEVSIPPGRPVQPGQYVRLQVTDSGAGMDAETLRRAAEPFFTTKGAGKGTGLGLSMVHGLAAQSGGIFNLRSEPGRGTTAEILLPVSTAEASAIPVQAGLLSPPLSGQRKLSVLAVDDDPLVLTGLVMVLEEQGHSVLEAYSGRQALDVLGDGAAVDVVVTDQVMPGMTGAQLAKTIRSRWPRLPVILATGYGETPEGAHAIPRLRKPFSPEQLTQALADALAEAWAEALVEAAGPASRSSA